MDRRGFIKTCTMVCLAASVFNEGCAPTKQLSSVEYSDRIVINKKSFLKSALGEEEKWNQYVVLHPSKYRFPICVFRSAAEEYTAVLMQCTHRGCELDNSGDHLSCPCHGSEFDSKGTVLNPPAEENLQNFNVTTTSETVIIHLS